MKLNRITFLLIAPLFFCCGKTSENKSVKVPEKSNFSDSTLVQNSTERWYTKLIENYIAHSRKQLIVDDRKMGKIDWILDDIQLTDSTNYYIFNIGHRETDEGNTNPRFTSDAWIYIDSLSHKVYEYDLPNDQLVLWKNN